MSMNPSSFFGWLVSWLMLRACRTTTCHHHHALHLYYTTLTPFVFGYILWTVSWFKWLIKKEDNLYVDVVNAPCWTHSLCSSVFDALLRFPRKLSLLRHPPPSAWYYFAQNPSIIIYIIMYSLYDVTHPGNLGMMQLKDRWTSTFKINVGFTWWAEYLKGKGPLCLFQSLIYNPEQKLKWAKEFFRIYLSITWEWTWTNM